MTKTTLVKIGGWVVTALAAVAISWASDKESKQQIDEKVQNILKDMKES